MVNKSASDIAAAWCSSFQSALDAKDIDTTVSLFGLNCWWKDHFNISFDFNALVVRSPLIRILRGRHSRGEWKLKLKWGSIICLLTDPRHCPRSTQIWFPRYHQLVRHST